MLLEEFFELIILKSMKIEGMSCENQAERSINNPSKIVSTHYVQNRDIVPEIIDIGHMCIRDLFQNISI